MSKFKEIISGWTNLVFHSPEAEKLANERAKICGRCQYNKFSICSQCGCPLSAKTRSTSATNKCPMGKW
jgi:ribosomal protein L37E